MRADFADFENVIGHVPISTLLNEIKESFKYILPQLKVIIGKKMTNRGKHCMEVLVIHSFHGQETFM